MPPNTRQLIGKTLPENEQAKYKIGEFLAGGGFGSVHIGKDVRRKNRVAIKFEWQDGPTPLLQFEYGFYRRLGSINARNRMNFLPWVPYFGSIDGYQALVMEMLGPSLSKMMTIVGGQFSIATTTQLLLQLLDILEYVHSCKLLYRDIKPDNFLLGPPKSRRWCQVYIIDLGFGKLYQTREYCHIPDIKNKPVAGTALFMSISNHLRQEVSRRDDLESLLYMAVYMIKGSLPWNDLPTKPFDDHEKMGNYKRDLSPEQLCIGMPPEYGAILLSILGLEFTEPPPYFMYRGQLLDILNLIGLDQRQQHYDFNKNHESIRNN